MDEEGKPEIYEVGEDTVMNRVLLQLAGLTGWTLVWREYTYAGWKLVPVRTEEALS